ncbi:MAG: threonine--tRNA ligase [Bacteriovoracaceae bacterium]|nr:threonine--tRNA ligase [Bacteriovoracaceae bacterium]
MAKYSIDTIRHSTAHLMAQATKHLFPDEDIKFGIGPVIDSGFYYDIEMEHRLSDDDLNKIEATMLEFISQNLPIERTVLEKSKALEYFTNTGQNLKVELIKELPDGEVITCYKQGDFTDLCRGPHVEHTGQLPRFFKLLHTAGAYWRGDSSRQMLQRIYATTWSDKKELKKYLNFLEEAKKRDHRKLGVDLELFHFDPVAPASPFFMPKGTFVYNELTSFIRRIYSKYNYKEVITPQILDTSLWHTSGHYENYHENMYFTNIDKREYAVKPMNCPCHMLMFKHYKYSYRDLPLRYADFGRLHRYEKSGTLAGLTRVRTFCQDDAHIFIQLDKILSEITTLLDMFHVCYDHFGFTNIKINLSTRPPKKVGDDATWDKAEAALVSALEQSPYQYQLKEGDGAFYGPKIDLEIADALERYHQLGTIQLDFQLPERFDLKFTNNHGELERPVVIHRALLGSLERFFGIYLEHIGGAYPFWLSPKQAIIVPVNNDSHLTFSKTLCDDLTKLGYRVKVDDRNESLGFKTRQIQRNKIPFMLVIGDREMESSSVNLRRYGEKKTRTTSIEELKTLFQTLDKEKIPKPLRD